MISAHINIKALNKEIEHPYDRKHRLAQQPLSYS
jgi:hypothetical protein